MTQNYIKSCLRTEMQKQNRGDHKQEEAEKGAGKQGAKESISGLVLRMSSLFSSLNDLQNLQIQREQISLGTV